MVELLMELRSCSLITDFCCSQALAGECSSLLVKTVPQNARKEQDIMKLLL
jgi:hypothetical protein